MSYSRLEKFIYAICSMDVSDLPVPLSRIEKLWNCLITGETPDFEPLSRNEKYLMAMLDRYDISNLPAPMSRGEKLLYKIAVGETDLSDVPGYLSRYEELLKYLIENGGISGGDFEYVLYTINQSLYTLYTTAEKPVKSAILKGLTLVNLSENLNTITISLDWWYLEEKLIDNIEKLKRNTYYTVLYRLENLSGNLESYDGNEVGIGTNGYEKNLPKEDIQTELDKNGGWCKIKFQLTDSFMSEYPTYKHLYIRPIRRSTAPVEGETIDYTIRGFAILEGDYMTNPIPFNEVFEGMQSVKMPVLKTTGKNLFDGIMTSGQLMNNSVIQHNQTKMGYSEFLPVEEKLDIYCSYYTNSIYIIEKIYFYDENKNQISSVIRPTKVTTPKGTKYFRVSITTTDWDSNVVFDDIKDDFNIQVEIGIQATPYEPYKSNILTVNEDVTLRSNGNICDELNLLTGQLTQRIDEDGEVLSQEVIKTVDLTTVDQDNRPTQLGTFENLTYVSLESAGLIPEVAMEVATNLLEDTVFNLTNAFNTLYPTAAKPVVDGTLYGQTLVNLLDAEILKGNKGKINVLFDVVLEGDYFVSNHGNGQFQIINDDGKSPFEGVFEEGKTYTLIMDVTITDKTRDGDDIYLELNTTTHTTSNLKFNNANGIIKKAFKATKRATPETKSVFKIGFYDNAITKINRKIMILEGDYTNVDIPYFEGMQSVKMPVLTTVGKNLWDKKNFVNGVIDGESIRVSAGDLNDTIFYYDFKENQQYVFTLTSYSENKKMVYFRYNYTDGTDSGFTNFLSYNGETKSFISSANKTISYISFVFSNHDNYTLSNVQLEEGSVATPYEPYKSITLSTPADLELRKVGEVQDELNVMTGEVTECIDEFILNGSEYWDIVNDTFRSSIIKDKVIKIETQADRDKIVISCDRYPSRTYNDPWSTGVGNFISLTVGKAIVIMDKNFTTVEEWKQYLSQNPLTVKFVLATPATKTVDLSIVNQDGNETKLRTFDDTTHVLLQSEAGPNPGASLTVKTKIPSASSTSLLMDDILTKQEQLNTTIDEQSNNVDATMIATTEIYEETL